MTDDQLISEVIDDFKVVVSISNDKDKKGGKPLGKIWSQSYFIDSKMLNNDYFQRNTVAYITIKILILSL